MEDRGLAFVDDDGGSKLRLHAVIFLVLKRERFQIDETPGIRSPHPGPTVRLDPVNASVGMKVAYDG